MISVQLIPDAFRFYVGALVVLIAIGIYLHGQSNHILSWPWAMATIIISPIFLLIYILIVFLTFRAERIRDDSKEKNSQELDFESLPSRWGDLIDKDGTGQDDAPSKRFKDY